MASEPIVNGCISDNGLTERSGPEEALKFAKKLYIHGGNISNWNRIKRKTTPSSADEVSSPLRERSHIHSSYRTSSILAMLGS